MWLNLQCAPSNCLDPFPLKSSEVQITGDHSLLFKETFPPSSPVVHTRKPEGLLRTALFGSVHHETPPWITCRKGKMLETCHGILIVTVLPNVDKLSSVWMDSDVFCR